MELKQFVKTTFAEDDRGVSPVIGVILMVAITVILAAVIATFVLGLGDQVESSPQAGVSFSVDSGTVTVTWVSEGNVDPSSTDLTIQVSGDCSAGSSTLSAIGNTADVTGCSDGDTITVKGTTPSGSSGVVGQYTYTT